ncbi:hypothetical protein FB566_2470 [Stackebrandtia endophytica]|uniref:Imm-5-like domain-containing protein n=1 Tax=Stackebrandtia endophytica TaxID=1496996 RepID=A0A543AWG6_9ACTN|nr:exonuclease SbcC [Stackebrandtia endophytica]TQL76926.1 hypothetical protein FB566_2470 [Stackebrandtia endophytica]
MTIVSGDFELTMGELRVVARYVVDSAEAVLPVFEAEAPDDPRPSAAIEAARLFVNGAKRTKLQRVTSLDAHRAAREVSGESAQLAARAAGDAASAAYLHPIAKATQVGHILRAAACAARVAELTDDDPTAADRSIEAARLRATPDLIAVLKRYPAAPVSRNRVGQLMTTLDDALRADQSAGSNAD